MDVGENSVQPLKSCKQRPTDPTLHQLIDKLAAHSLNSSKKILQADTYQSLAIRLNESIHQTQTINFVQELICTLIDYASKMRQELAHSISRQEYEVLQEAVQKSEGEIRKHIKIQQQLKLYLDSLQEKIQELQNRLEIEQEKYNILFENFKQLDQSHKKLTQQFLEPAQTKKPTLQYQFKSMQSASNENVMSRKTKLGLKNRLIMERLQERTRKTQQKKHNQMLSITQEEVNLHAEPQPIAKRSSNDRYKKESQGQYSIKELTKSLQMKQDRSVDSHHYKKQSKVKKEKEGRSSSIIH